MIFSEKDTFSSRWIKLFQPLHSQCILQSKKHNMYHLTKLHTVFLIDNSVRFGLDISIIKQTILLSCFRQLWHLYFDFISSKFHLFMNPYSARIDPNILWSLKVYADWCRLGSHICIEYTNGKRTGNLYMTDSIICDFPYLWDAIEILFRCIGPFGIWMSQRALFECHSRGFEMKEERLLFPQFQRDMFQPYEN